MRASISTISTRRRNLALRSPWDDANTGGVFALSAYRSLWWIFSPFVGRALKRRAALGKEDRERLSERLGTPSRARPPGTLIWVHGASVGECLAALPLTQRLLEKDGRHIILTSGTVTSAKLMAERLPLRAFHQYAPIDRRDVVERFLGHWRPDLALFIESELWPNRVVQTHEAGVPIALVNARLSTRSFHGWQRALGAARKLLACIDICLAQDETIAEQLKALGAPRVRIAGSLKADSPPLPYDENALAAFHEAVGGREIFLAAQTHRGEEETILSASEIVRRRFPSLLTVIVPRHPERGEEIASLARTRNLSIARRALGEMPALDTQVYVADTLGELGLFYRAVPFVFLGGSLVPRGGHNPLEPAILGVSVLTGPHIENFDETFRTLLSSQGDAPVKTEDEMSAQIAALLADPTLAADKGACAKAAVAKLSGALERTIEAAEELLARHARP